MEVEVQEYDEYPALHRGWYNGFSIYHKTKIIKKNNENIFKTICIPAPVINSCKQNRMYTLLVILFIRNSFKEYLYTLLNKILWLSSCLAKLRGFVL
jgi:hypothetical protein